MSEWYGWLRRDRRHKWQRVCGPCGTLSECSRLLGGEARRLGIVECNTCLTTGAYPRDVQAGIAAAAPTPPAEDGAEPNRPSGRYLEGC